MSIPYLYTLRRTIAYAYTLPNAITYLYTCISILIHWLGSRLHILIHCRLVSAAPSATNQNRVLRHPSRQPITIEHPSRHYVTRELSAPGRPFSALRSSRLAIAYLNIRGSPTPPPPPNLISSHSYYLHPLSWTIPFHFVHWSVGKAGDKRNENNRTFDLPLGIENLTTRLETQKISSETCDPNPEILFSKNNWSGKQKETSILELL